MSIIEDDESRIILDNGTWMTRAGYSGDEEPYAEVRTLVGRPINDDGDAWCYGEIARMKNSGHRGTMELEYPINDGMIVDFDKMQSLWDYIFEKELKFTTKGASIMIADSPENPRLYREHLAEVFFEYYSFDRMSIQLQPVLAMFATGNMTGLSVDIGLDSYTIVPVVDGHSDFEAGPSVRIELGGSHINKCLSQNLLEKGYNLMTKEGQAIIEAMKISKGHYNIDMVDCEYTMPDGQILKIDESAFIGPEVLFDPSLIGRNESGIGDYCWMAVKDYEKEVLLMNNVVCSGMSCRLAGFERRLQIDLGSTDQVRVRSIPSAIWTGGSIFTSTITFENNSITRQDYEDYGPGAIHEKIL